MQMNESVSKEPSAFFVARRLALDQPSEALRIK